MKQFSRQTGFTLIEVMVTVFVLAVGILGVAGMQAVSVRESGNLYFRTQADLLIGDIVDRMRANRLEARGTEPGGPQAGSGSTYNGINTSNNITSAGCSASQCDTDALATDDAAEWGQAITNSRLPSAIGVIDHMGDSTNISGAVVGSIYRVRIFWDEDRDGDTGQGCDPSNAADMACSSLIVEI